MINWFKSLYMLPSPLVMAQKELVNAQRELLVYYSMQENATGNIQANLDKIARLKLMIKEFKSEVTE